MLRCYTKFGEVRMEFQLVQEVTNAEHRLNASMVASDTVALEELLALVYPIYTGRYPT